MPNFILTTERNEQSARYCTTVCTYVTLGGRSLSRAQQTVGQLQLLDVAAAYCAKTKTKVQRAYHRDEYIQFEMSEPLE